MASIKNHQTFGDLVQKFSQAYEPQKSGIRRLNRPALPEFRTFSNGVPEPWSSNGVPEVVVIKQENHLRSQTNPKKEDESGKLSKKAGDLEALLNEIFSIVSALKISYIKLQAAHSPYDLEGLQLADKLIVSDLKKLSKLKHSFLKKEAIQNVGANGHGNCAAFSPHQDGEESMVKRYQELEDACNEKKKMLETCQGEIESYRKQIAEKNAEITSLKASLEKAQSEERNLESLENKSDQEYVNHGPSNGVSSDSCTKLQLFEILILESRETASNFTQILINSMLSAHWDLSAAANSVEPGVFYSRPYHRKFAFESYVCNKMYRGFENEHYCLSGCLSSLLEHSEKHRHESLLRLQEMRSLHPRELIKNSTPDCCFFGKFCHQKYLQIVHEKMDQSFFGDLQHRAQVLNGADPSSDIYESFLKFAKAVWLLHSLACSFKPAAKIFLVRKDVEFHPSYMESVTENPDLSDNCSDLRPRVALTVTPGFRAEGEVFKCRVYINEHACECS